MNPIELIQFVQSQLTSESDQLRALAALADAPGEDFQAKIRLPVQNPLPAFKLGNDSLGSVLADHEYGVPAPVIGQSDTSTKSIGQMLVGEM